MNAASWLTLGALAASVYFALHASRRSCGGCSFCAPHCEACPLPIAKLAAAKARKNKDGDAMIPAEIHAKNENAKDLPDV